MRPSRKPTCISRVIEALVAADDFMTGKQIAALLPDEPTSRISASLSHLLKYGAVEYLESEQKIWWYATLDKDRRQRVYKEIKENISHNRKKPSKRSQRKPYKDSYK